MQTIYQLAALTALAGCAVAALAQPIAPTSTPVSLTEILPYKNGADKALLQYRALQRLKKRFDAADMDGSGSLNREEASKAGLGFIQRNFDHIDTRQRGDISFDDLKAYVIQRREEARSR